MVCQTSKYPHLALYKAGYVWQYIYDATVAATPRPSVPLQITEVGEPEEPAGTTDTGKRSLEEVEGEPGAKRPKLMIAKLEPPKQLGPMDKGKAIELDESLEQLPIQQPNEDSSSDTHNDLIDGNKEEGSSSEDRQLISTAHEMGESSGTVNMVDNIGQDSDEDLGSSEESDEGSDFDEDACSDSEQDLNTDVPLTEEEINDLIDSLFEVESKAADAQETLEEESLATIRCEIEDELAAKLSGSELDAAVKEELRTFVEQWQEALDKLEDESGVLQERLDDAGVELSSLFKWMEKQAPQCCSTEAWRKRAHWAGLHPSEEVSNTVQEAESQLERLWPVKRHRGKLLEEGASGYLEKKVLDAAGARHVTGSKVQKGDGWESLDSLLGDEGIKSESSTFGSEAWASVYLAATPEQAARLGLAGADEVEEIVDLEGCKKDFLTAMALATEKESGLTEFQKKNLKRVGEEEDIKRARIIDRFILKRRRKIKLLRSNQGSEAGSEKKESVEASVVAATRLSKQDGQLSLLDDNFNLTSAHEDQKCIPPKESENIQNGHLKQHGEGQNLDFACKGVDAVFININSDEEQVPAGMEDTVCCNESAMASIPLGTDFQNIGVNNPADMYGVRLQQDKTKDLDMSDVPRMEIAKDSLSARFVCTMCGKPLSCDQVLKHPLFDVVVCRPCRQFYQSGPISKDTSGRDNECSWCANGGDVVLCDGCDKVFCGTCIERNFGGEELERILDREDWRCYCCNDEPLVSKIDCFMRASELGAARLSEHGSSENDEHMELRPDDVTEEVSSSQGKQTREVGDGEPKVFGLSITSSSVSASWVTGTVARACNGLLKAEDCEFNTRVKEGSSKKNSPKKYFQKEAPKVTEEPAKSWKSKATTEPTKGPAKKWKRPFVLESEEEKVVLRLEHKCFICEQPGHIAPNRPQRKRAADFEDKEDRNGKKPMAGLVPYMVGDKPNSDGEMSTPQEAAMQQMIQRFEGRDISNFCWLYEQSMEDNGIQDREAVDGFHLIVVLELRTQIAELQAQQGADWQEFKKVLKEEYFLEHSQRDHKRVWCNYLDDAIGKLSLTSDWKLVPDAVNMIVKRQMRVDKLIVVDSLETAERGKVPRGKLSEAGNSIRETTGWFDLVDSLSVYAYIAESEVNEAMVEEKWKRDEETAGSSKRATKASNKKEEGTPPKPTPEVNMEDAPKDKKQELEEITLNKLQNGTEFVKVHSMDVFEMLLQSKQDFEDAIEVQVETMYKTVAKKVKPVATPLLEGSNEVIEEASPQPMLRDPKNIAEHEKRRKRIRRILEDDELEESTKIKQRLEKERKERLYRLRENASTVGSGSLVTSSVSEKCAVNIARDVDEEEVLIPSGIAKFLKPHQASLVFTP
ncbi:hypothetical protein L7F22_052241 [Adiantum nelumboides]|nr:hypothetical protein [Adiantum nelumboides]